jgi:hypothetical protein
MLGIDSFKINLSLNPALLVLFAALALTFAFFIYRFTLPPVKKLSKIVLIGLRTLALIGLITMVFEPVLIITKKKILEPINLIFIDNSKSILIDDGYGRSEVIRNFISGIEESNILPFSELYSFGSDIRKENYDSLKQINFTEGTTNFVNIFNDIIKDERNISSITIVSDGVITDGSNPLFAASELGIPVFTVGVGDSSRKDDISIKNVLHNEMIYAKNPTTLVVTIINKGFAGQNITLTFEENGKQLSSKNLVLDEEGNQQINIDYTPQSGGEKKISISINTLKGESNPGNNRRVFYLKVLDNKIKVLLLAGSPSTDLSFLKNSVKQDENIKVDSYTEIGPGRILEKNFKQTFIDSADVFFLIGYPSRNSDQKIWEKVSEKISQLNKPFFITMSAGVDLNKLSVIKNDLPFSFDKHSDDYREVQLTVSYDQLSNPLLISGSGNSSDWNNLPPVFQPIVNFAAKPEANVLASIKIREMPLKIPILITRKISSKRSIAVLAKDIWRWKLQTTERYPGLFDNFIFNSIKWLNSSEIEKQVKIKSLKKLYSAGEEIEFAAEVYNEAFNPVADAEVRLNITGDEFKREILLTPIGNGLYEGSLKISKSGDYNFSGSATYSQKILGTDRGSFNIGEVNIEMLDDRMNYEFLSNLAARTNGKYFDSKNFAEVFSAVSSLTAGSSKVKLEKSKFNLWSSEWLMIITILLFSMEWFLRKRRGML